MTAGIYGGLGLAAQRLSLGPSTLVTTSSDHVALRTPSRPEVWHLNALHLLRPPADLAPWRERFARNVGAVPGVATTVLAWEVEDTPDGPDVAVPPGATVHDPTVLELDGPLDDVDDPGDLELVAATDDRHWAGAKVLYLQTDWDGDERHWRWLVGEHRAVAAAGRGATWVAYRYGIPVGRAALFHDRYGLAVVEDVITHPLYRGQGIATALIRRAVAAHLADHPRDRVVIVAERSGGAQRLYRRLGFVPRSTIFTVVAPGVAGTGD